MALNQKKYNSEENSMDERQLRLQHRFLVLRKLGQGTYGKVQLALNKETNEEVAVKTIKKAKIENEEDMLRIRREIHIMTSMKHPHIIHINEVFETRQKIVIVMQYASGGELYDYLGCHQTLPEEEARRIFRQIASAIYHCHKNRICHRDLKLENILLDEQGNAQIADFGLSNIFDDKRRMNTFCGSPLYASPEIVKGTPYKGPEVDCWSLGVLLYTLVYGTMPFDGRSFKELVSQISEGRYKEPVIRSNASSLIRWLLTPDISRRATIIDVCKDSWINYGYDTSLLLVSENMSLSAGLSQQEKNATKLCLETNAKNEREKSTFKETARQVEEKAENFSSILAKNFENITKTNDANLQPRKSNLYDQITNYDVRFVLNKIIAAVEASLSADKNTRNLTTAKTQVCNMQRKEESITKKVDSAYVIPIFEVTSTIPNKRDKTFQANQDRGEMQNKITNGISSNRGIPYSEKESCMQPEFQMQTSENASTKIQQQNLRVGKHSSQVYDTRNDNLPSINSCSRNQSLLTESQKQYYSLNISGQDTCKTDFENRKQRDQDNPMLRNPSQKTKRDGFSFAPKLPSPFMRTKHHVLSLARILSLNYEKIKRNSFRMPTCKKKPPGKITIPPTFDPNNPPAAIKKQQEEKKELFLFPMVSVSENKEKIEKKIDKIKKAALNKNMIIRSDSKTRLRIEKYIMSQVRRIQDLVSEEQRSIHASLENLDEQSLRDMSEMYYRAFGSENTDSGIANEDEEYFCFLCSKPSAAKGTSGVIDSEVLERIKKGCLYSSNHLHIPKGKDHNRWNFVSNNNGELGTLSRCKSEIEFPMEYLNYISANNSDLSKRTQQGQQLLKNNIGNTKCYFTVPPALKPVNSNLRILRSASDSVGLHLNNNSYEVVKLNTDSHDDVLQNYHIIPHFLEQISPSNRCDTSQMTDHYETQSFATDTEQTMSMNTSRMSEKDDGIGDSNDSFQSYMETFENNIENISEISRSKSSHSYINFTENVSKNKNALTKRLSSEPYLMHKNGIANFESQFSGVNKIDALETETWASLQNTENKLDQLNGKSKGLRRRNTMTCVLDETERGEELKLDQTSTEFENYLWNAYKEHLLQNTQSDTEFLSSPNLNYYSLDRKTKFKSRDCRSVDYINGDPSSDYFSANFANFTQNSDQESNNSRSLNVRNILKHSNTSKNQSERSSRSLSRTKSIAGEMLSDSDREEMIRKLRAERKPSQGSISYDTNNSKRKPFFSNFLNDLEQRDQERRADRETSRRRISKSTLPHSKKPKSEYKKSFLQLLALKRVQDAEKELDKVHRNDLPEVEEENPGSLLEALKTHGYKSVISQRFQDTNADCLDTYQAYLKSPRNLRAELARLNYIYHEALPRYTFDPYEENDYLYDDYDYTTCLGNGFAIPSSYDVHKEFRQKTPKQSVHDWLNTTQTDEYLNYFRSDSLYTPDETTPTSDSRKYCPQRGKENIRSFDDESTSESQDTAEEHVPNDTFNNMQNNKESACSKKPTNHSRTENALTSDDEKQESVQDRIWRKSFYSRFNNRALSRKERSSSILEPEFLSESRLGLLNNLYNPPRTGFERSETSPWDGSNKSFQTKKLRKHSSSFDKYESSNNIKKRYARLSKERESVLESKPSNSNEVCEAFSAPDEIEPEH